MPYRKSATPVAMGDIARDRVTGFEGVVVCRTEWLNNCTRWTLQPQEAKGGKATPSHSFDEPDVEFVKKSKISVLEVSRPSEDKQVNLGDEVKDNLSGLSGVVVAQAFWINGCSKLAVQPKELKDGEPVPSTWVDEKDVKITKRLKEPRAKVATGGPRMEPRQ